ncbi:PadR family transcriptional regulator [Paenibacillus marchantiophytorum]|uniref:PadR family transcriptional regulator n=1 Tax=Paenibacillus marchantiophytorum TaxID=1619310 RepID=A0ABQ1F5V0_9BACL|nr:PadR family transcriptional regulator [Paenibacillus marchantiophytorum]GGA00134.1 PadR family transcriptional regulator [Paenibacillus marchantiophytorum]
MSNDKLQRSYLPMSETAYYILLSLAQIRHGYGIMQHVEEITKSRIKLGPGTLYGSLSKMEKDKLIAVIAEEERRKMYQITPLGREILTQEISRIRELYHNSKQMEADPHVGK